MIVALWNIKGFSKPAKEPLKFALYYSLYFLVLYVIVSIFLIGKIGLEMTITGLFIFYIVTLIALLLWAVIHKTLYSISKKYRPKLEE